MMKKYLKGSFTALVASLCVPGFGFGADDAKKTTFADDILPLLEDRCLNCHNPDEKKGGLELSSYSGLMEGGSGGGIVVPGDHGSSRMFTTTAKLEEPYMPPKGDALTKDQLSLIAGWIDGGLLENSGSVALKPKKSAIDLTKVVTFGRPEKPAMPEHLSLQPVIVPPRANAITVMAASPWAPLVAIAGEQQVLIYHAQSRQLAAVLPFEHGVINDVGFSKNGSLIFAAGGVHAKSGVVVAWDVVTGRQILEVGKEYDAILTADMSADQSLIVIGTSAKKVKAYSTGSGDEVYQLGRHSEWVVEVACSPDGKLLATADRNGGILIWETENGGEYFTLEGHRKGITGLSWRADGQVLASCSEDGEIRLWEKKEGKRIKNWGAHGGGALSVSYAPDGRLVSTGRDKSFKIWDGQGKQLKAVGNRPDIMTSSAFLHDSKSVVTGNWIGEARMWSADEAKEVASLSATPPKIESRLGYFAKLGEESGKQAAATKTQADDMTRLRIEAEAKYVLAKKTADEGRRKREAALAVAKQKQAEFDKKNVEKASQVKERDRLRALAAQTSEVQKQIQIAEAERAEFQKKTDARLKQAEALASSAAEAKKASDAAPEDSDLKKAAEQAGAAHLAMTKSHATLRAEMVQKDGHIAGLKKQLKPNPAGELAKHEARIKEIDGFLAAAKLTITQNTNIAQTVASQQGANDKQASDMDAKVKAMQKEEAERKAAADAAAAKVVMLQKKKAFWTAQQVNVRRVEQANVLAEVTATSQAAADAIAGVEAEIKAAEAAITGAQKRIPELEAQRKGAQADLPKKAEAAKQAVAGKVPHQQARDQAVADRDAKQKAFEAATAATKAAQTALDQFVAQRSELQKKIDAGTGILAGTDKQVATAKAAQTKAVAALNKLEKQLQLASAAKLQADGNLAGSDRQLAETKKEFDATPEADKAEREALQKSVAMVTDMRNLADQQRKKSAEHVAAIQNTRNQRAGVKGAADKKVGDLGNLRNTQAAALDAAKKALGEWDASEANKKRRGELDGAKNQKVAAAAEAKKQVDAAVALLAQKEESLKKATAVVAAAEKARVEAEKLVQSLDAQIEQAKGSVPANQKKITELKTKLADLVKQKADLDKQAQTLKPEVDKLKAEYLSMLPK